MSQTENERALESEKISKLLIRFSVPCIIAMLVSSLYNIVDQIFIGQGIGYIGNAATTVVYPFTVIALAIAYTLGDGAAALFSLSLGKKDYKTANKTFSTALITSIFSSIVLTVIGFLFTDGILTFFGVTENSYQYAVDYLRIILIGLPFYIITNSLNGLIRADGSPKFAMFSTLIRSYFEYYFGSHCYFYFGLGN